MIELSDPTTEEERRNNKQKNLENIQTLSKATQNKTHPIEERRQKVENKETVQNKERLHNKLQRQFAVL